MRPRRLLLCLSALLAVTSLSGCGWFGMGLGTSSRSERECLIRAMYFESHRSDPEGLLAVGSVVMNRVADRRYPKTICGVVGQKNQFAAGVLNRPMNERSLYLVAQVAQRVLRGERHPAIRRAMHFHQAGLRFPYNNMHYVLQAGGNEFYEKY